MTRAGVLGLVTCAALARPAHAGVEQTWRRVQAAVDRAVAERAPRPPAPVEVSWRERRIGALDLGAALLAMAAADLDRDGRAELVALTAREVVVLSAAAGVVHVAARADLGGEPAPLRPRDPVGSIVIDASGAETGVWARSSERADAVGLASRRGALVEVGRQPGFPLCRGATAELVKGRNYFAASQVTWKAGAARVELPAELFGMVCRDDLVDTAGRPMAVAAVMDVDRVLRVTCRGAAGACGGVAREVAGAGVATAIADVDNDGRPEVLSTRGGAPGDRDRVTVHGRDGAKVFARDFHAGVVGLAAADLDGDGDRDVVAAVRFEGSTQASFWTLN